MDFDAGYKIISRYLDHLSTRATVDDVFRGHANKDWPIVPSTFRRGSFGITSSTDLNRWKTLAKRFVERPLSDLEWLVLAQHYGVPTALLDWTTSPLIALYFACQTHFENALGVPTDGAVLMLSRKGMPRENGASGLEIFQPWSGPPLLVDALAMNRRSLAQDSVMTLHCQGNHTTTPGYDPTIFLVGQREKMATLAALRTMGVSSDRIYADINTVAREYIDELVQAGWKRMYAMKEDLLSPPASS